MKDLKDINAQTIKEITTDTLLDNEIIKEAYDELMLEIIECAKQGKNHTISTVLQEAYNVYDELVIILEFKGFTVFNNYYISW